jgi:hypothetical protein
MSDSSVPGNRLQEILKEEIRVPMLYSGPHLTRLKPHGGSPGWPSFELLGLSFKQLL